MAMPAKERRLSGNLSLSPPYWCLTNTQEETSGLSVNYMGLRERNQRVWNWENRAWIRGIQRHRKRWRSVARSWKQGYEGVCWDIWAGAGDWEEKDREDHRRMCPGEHEPARAGSQVAVKPFSIVHPMEK